MKQLVIGDWEIKVGEPRQISINTVEKLEKFLTVEWLEAVVEIHKEDPWWGLEHLGLPSPIVRVDMAPCPADDGDIKNFIYEVEVRPAGLGLFLSMSPEAGIKEVLTNCGCQGFINIRSSIQDDYLAAEMLGLPYFKEVPPDLVGPYWVRTNEREGEVLKLERVSLVPIRSDGDKRYLIRLGMAKEVSHSHDLDWDAPFVIKPIVGARMEGVEIYIPPSLQKSFSRGSSTKNKIIQSISSRSYSYLIQPFIPPQLEGDDGCWSIWRLFFGFFCGRYRFLGGLWNQRPNLRIHGSSDATFGVIS